MRRRGTWAGGVLVLLLGSGVYYFNHHTIPNRVHACGRDYGHREGATGAGPFTLDELRKREGRDLTVRQNVYGYELWTHRTCGLGVFLRVDANRFLGYGLVGGP